MRLLLRGQVILTVFAKRNPELRLRGAIGTRITCDVFDSLITAANSSEEHGKPTPAAGLAWIYIGKNGNIIYHIQLPNLKSAVTKVTIEANAAKTKKSRLIEDVTHVLASNWINGTLNRLVAKDYELLYEGEFFINVATERSESELRGKIVPRIASESHFAMNNGPILLNAINGTRAGLGWVNVDHQCNFHYDVNVIAAKSTALGSARREHESLTVLELVDVPRVAMGNQGIGSPGPSGITLMDGGGSAYGNGNVLYMPNIRLLEEFSGNQVENSISDLPQLSLARMDAGVAYLKLTEPAAFGTPGAELQGWLNNVIVLPYFTIVNILFLPP